MVRGAVELLGQHRADQPVRPGQAAEGEAQVGARRGRGRPARRGRRSGRPRRAGPRRARRRAGRRAPRWSGRGRARPGRRRRHPAGRRASSRSASASLAALGRHGAARLDLDQADRPGAAAGVVGEQRVDRRRRGRGRPRRPAAPRRLSPAAGGGPARRRHRPELLDVVEGAGLGAEQVDEHVAGVDQDPGAGRRPRALRRGRARWPAAFSRSISFSAIDGDVPLRGAGGDHHEVGERGLAGEIDDGGLERLVVVERALDELEQLAVGGGSSGSAPVASCSGMIRSPRQPQPPPARAAPGSPSRRPDAAAAGRTPRPAARVAPAPPRAASGSRAPAKPRAAGPASAA